MKANQPIIIDATPAMAAVVSGQTRRPTDYNKKSHGYFWRWAIDTPAVRAIAKHYKFNLPAPLKGDKFWSWGTPNNMPPKGDHRRWQPWIDPNQPEDKFGQFDEAAKRLRAALGVANAGIIFSEETEVTVDGGLRRSAPLMIAVNEDGTRAAIMFLRYK
jgi:hypothetical protein